MVDLENVDILGYTGVIEDVPATLDIVNNLRDNCCDGCLIQLLDADGIAGYKHALHGVNQALLAFERENNLANDLGVEILVRIAGTRQIAEAFKTLGLKTGKMNLCIILINCPDYFKDQLNHIFTKDDTVLQANEEKLLKKYEISQKQLNTMNITDILIDKTTKLITDQ